ncbi:ribonuclease II [Carex littledalei]|uniref:Ribonuclease II n=1 Tax=Carex littledalei TaxID=544730 RepID=A0A833VDV8_9POAL|nr:ribonuclease II [Carex littledalei]
MANRTMSLCSILGFFHHRSLPRSNSNSLGFVHPDSRFWSFNLSLSFTGGDHTRFHGSLMDLVMEELQHQTRTRASSQAGLTSIKDGPETKAEKKTLQKGTLLEFEKDSKKLVLAVVHRPDKKQNWIVLDQNGFVSSIRPQQITYIVPGIEVIEYSDIADFAKKAEELLDPSILECAWMEVLERNQWATMEEIAEIMYGSTGPLECYCTHVLLSRDDIYFVLVETRDSLVYDPRSTDEVEDLIKRKMTEEIAKKELDDFVQTLYSAKALPYESKPAKSSWLVEAKVREMIESLVAFATGNCKSDCKSEEQRELARNILSTMGMSKLSSAAVGLLMDIGYFPIHVNLDVLKMNIRTEHNYKTLLAAEQILARTTDPDEHIRTDLTSLKVYAIDVDEADELDDALSATRLSDGRIKVWIHVADTASWVDPFGTLDKEALHRGTSVYLPTATLSMFPEKLALEKMSLRQGELCRAVSVSVVLDHDGNIIEYAVENTTIKPTYMLTYESATELLYLNLEEEEELQILSDAASLRYKWRHDHGALDTTMPEARIKVSDPDNPDPTISLYTEGDNSAKRLVTEMMILCNEVIADFGSSNGIPLPYRSQPQANISDYTAFDKLPAGPVRSFAYIRVMRAADMNFHGPLPHATLGIDGYVQFTSPIRRYVDLLAHFQIKAYLRGHVLPLSAKELQKRTFVANMHMKIARRLQSTSLRYWLLEYLRRQPTDKTYRALILRFIKDRTATLLLFEVALQETCVVSSKGSDVGDQIKVVVIASNPRRDYLILREV